MADDTYWQLDREYYTIITDADFLVRVIEHEEISRWVGEGASRKLVKESVPKKVHEFKVNRDVVASSSAVFGKLISPPQGFHQSAVEQNRVDLLEDYPASIDLWFKILHGLSGSDLQSTYRDTDLKGVWEMLATAHKYALSPTTPAAKKWFDGWFNAQSGYDYEVAQALLFPCHTFDNADAFALITKLLAYNARGHITERKPEGYQHDHLRLDQQIMQQLNAAKGRLKTILHRGLYKPVDKLLDDTRCRNHPNKLYAYERALKKTGAWPVETAFLKNSIETMTSKLDNVNTSSPHADTGNCMECIFSFEETVTSATYDTNTYFDGLCLDCMDASKPKFGDADEDYWRHSENNRWDDGCRIKHGQPSWYFSFMGRRQKQIEWNQKQRA